MILSCFGVQADIFHLCLHLRSSPHVSPDNVSRVRMHRMIQRQNAGAIVTPTGIRFPFPSLRCDVLKVCSSWAAFVVRTFQSSYLDPFWFCWQHWATHSRGFSIFRILPEWYNGTHHGLQPVARQQTLVLVHETGAAM